MADFMYLIKKATGTLTFEEEQAERMRQAQEQQLRGASVQTQQPGRTMEQVLTPMATTGVHPAQQGGYDAAMQEMKLQEEIARRNRGLR